MPFFKCYDIGFKLKKKNSRTVEMNKTTKSFGGIRVSYFFKFTIIMCNFQMGKKVIKLEYRIRIIYRSSNLFIC